MRARAAALAVAAVVTMSACGSPGAGPGAPVPPPDSAGAPRDLLPDLDQEAPTGVVVRRAREGGRVVERLGFDSAVGNVGDGPMLVRGRRPDRSRGTMSARQIVRRTEGGARVVREVGAMRYVTSPDHAHWHLLGFERYELRAAADGALAARDRKTGFCLGDRYALERSVPGAPEREVYTGRCGIGATRLREVVQGISVGYGDDYAAILEGQYVDVTDVPAGRYVLVHRVDPAGRLAERSRADNAASVAIALARPGGRARVRVLRSCPAAAACPVG